MAGESTSGAAEDATGTIKVGNQQPEAKALWCKAGAGRRTLAVLHSGVLSPRSSLPSPRLSLAQVMPRGTRTPWGLVKEGSPPGLFRDHEALLTYKVLSIEFICL